MKNTFPNPIANYLFRLGNVEVIDNKPFQLKTIEIYKDDMHRRSAIGIYTLGMIDI